MSKYIDFNLFIFKKRFQGNFVSNGIPLYKLATQYRTVQLLGKLFNEILQRVFVSVILVYCVLRQAICSALVIVAYKMPQVNLVEVGVVGLMQLDTATALVVLIGGLSQVYATSSEVIYGCRKYSAAGSSFSKAKYRSEIKFLKSCSHVMVAFGELNYIDKVTPLNSIDFSNNLAVQFLLLGKRAE